MVRNIIFMFLGAVTGAGVIYNFPATCDVVIEQTDNLIERGSQGTSE